MPINKIMIEIHKITLSDNCGKILISDNLNKSAIIIPPKTPIIVFGQLEYLICLPPILMIVM
jgi:hypothetical protein